MTYLEKITYLTGNFIQLSQFVVKNAFRLISLYSLKEDSPYKIESDVPLLACEGRANSLLKDFTFKGSDDILSFLDNKGLSIKIYKELTYVLKKRDYVVSMFYIENSKDIAREEIAVYVSKINELQEYCDKAKELNVSLAKLADQFYQQYR